jgi:DNA-binding response OmpR family regulator
MGTVAPLEGLNVVLVDDEFDTLEFLALVLAGEGADVVPFVDPRAALAHTIAHPPDALLSDLYMPDLTGWELVEELHLRGVRTPAAAITAHPSRENRARCVAAGFCACIAKPLAPGELVSLVRALTRR